MKRMRILTKLTLEGRVDLPNRAQVLDVQPSAIRSKEESQTPEWLVVYAVPEEL